MPSGTFSGLGFDFGPSGSKPIFFSDDNRFAFCVCLQSRYQNQEVGFLDASSVTVLGKAVDMFGEK
jgi:hypothetical protein